MGAEGRLCPGLVPVGGRPHLSLPGLTAPSHQSTCQATPHCQPRELLAVVRLATADAAGVGGLGRFVTRRAIGYMPGRAGIRVDTSAAKPSYEE